MNLGNRPIKTDALRAHFEALKFANVGTFFARKNVLFPSSAGNPAKCDASILSITRELTALYSATPA